MDSNNATHPSVAIEALGFQQVIDYLNNAQAVAERLGYRDPALRPAYLKHVLMLLSVGYIQVFGTSVEMPNWVPYISLYFPWGAPNPDDNYKFAPIDARGTYRVSGIQGTAALSAITLKMGGAHHGLVSSGKRVDEIDLNALETDKDGRYSFLVSPERPAGYAGIWFKMHPDTTQFMYRSRPKGPTQMDGNCVLERLDRPAGSTMPNAAQVAEKLTMVTSYASRHNEFLLNYLNSLRQRGAEQGFIDDDQSNYGGLKSQAYLMHLFALGENEALILESDVPEQIEYWSVQLYDPHFSAIDFVFHTGAYNDEQAHIDSDGRVRFVVAGRDPCVPNWLDMAGWPRAGILWRWTHSNRYPMPAVKKVPLAQLRDYLPADTPHIDAEQRQAALALRTTFYETRGQ